MIKKITLDNFKAFAHAEIDIKPITILVGPNNGGKTSLLQPINLIKQTLIRGSDVLSFPLNLGGFDTVIHQNAKENEIGLRYDFDEGTYFSIKVKKDEDGKLSLKDFSCNDGSYEYKIKNIKKNEIKDDAKKESEYYTSDNFKIESRSKKDEPWLKGLKSDFYRETFFLKIRTSVEEQIDIDKTVTKFYDQIKKNRNKKLEQISKQTIKNFFFDRMNFYLNIQKMSSDFYQNIKSSFDKIIYVGPIRDLPRPSYEIGGHYDSVGFGGQNAVSMIAEDPELRDKTQKKLIDLEIANSLEILKFDTQKSFEFKLMTDIAEDGVNFRDVGCGTSQILPLLVQALYSQGETMIIIEQPEVHLHPKVQADFASFMVEIIKSKKNKFLIETHSEYLIERIRTCIMKDSKLADDVVIYYVEQNKKEKQSVITKIEIDSNGQYSALPENYLINFKLKEMDTQMNLMIERLKKVNE